MLLELELLECWFALSEEVELSDASVLVSLIVPQFVLPRGAAAAAAVVIVAVCFALLAEATAPGAETTTLAGSAGGVVVVVVDEEEEEGIDEIDTFGVVMLVVVAVVPVDSFNTGSLTDSFMLV